MNTYLKVYWKHQFDDEPVLIFSELDLGRREKRKIEVFKDGLMIPVAAGIRHGKTRLSEEPLPSIVEIATDSQFGPCEITFQEFEEAWNQAMTR